MTRPANQSLLRVTAVAVLAVSALTAALGTPADVAARPAQTKTITFDYDCATVPWRCDGARRENRWQAWEVRCPPSGCVWRWLKRANPAETIDLMNGGFYRLWFGWDNEYGDIASYRIATTPGAREFYIDISYLCSRNPFLCGGEEAWQVYTCTELSDGSCRWVWSFEMTGNMTGVYALLDYANYLFYWGKPNARPEPATPTPTPTATPTATMTSIPTDTSQPTVSPAATDPPTTTPTASPSPSTLPPTMTTPTALVSPTRQPTATSEPHTTPRPVYLPKTLRHAR